MTTRPTKETLESLRVTLQRLEQTADPAADADSLAQIKRIFLSRIADLEMQNALPPSASETTTVEARTNEAIAAPEPTPASVQNSSELQPGNASNKKP